jgi:DNA topoisomerase-3
MQLVIAEKPSVARDLARVLGVRGSGRQALVAPERVITWCIGHLVELEEPASYDGRWKAWRLDTLPMIPELFKLRPVAGTRDQLRAVRELLRDRRFAEVVNACDAGREGELIFRYVYELAGSRLPVRRLWISSLTDEAIGRGFAALRPGADYDPLADAARCRSEADWLVGMNATRAVTVTRRSAGPWSGTPGPAARSPAPAATPPRSWRSAATRGGRPPGRAPQSPVYSIGRVQTPTLAIVVRREQAIRSFQPVDYWEVRGTFTTPAGTFGARWGVGSRSTSTSAPTAPESSPARGAGSSPAIVTRFADRALAAEIVTRDQAHAAMGDPAGPLVERVRQKKSREPPPQLFDLTSLQRTANRRYGLSATRTLEAAQALYERHKLLTYPRTDSRHLSNDLAAELPRLFRGIAQIPEYASFAQALLDRPPARSARVFDDAKVQDHHAIIPTGKAGRLDALATDERRVFDLVVRRFLGVFFPDAEFALTDAVIRVGGDAAEAPVARAGAAQTPALDGAAANDETLLRALPPTPDRFFARGRIRLEAGWQEVAQIGEPRREERDGRAGGSGEPDGAAEAAATLPPLTEGQRLAGAFESVSRQTRPPPHHTEATLLGAMEYAGRDIEDEALRAAMKDTGLGTPATRAATIETLVKRGFIERQAKQIVATATGIALIDALPVASLASAELTGAWEARLARIARRQETRAAFMNDIGRYVHEVVDAIRGSAPGGAAHRSNAPAAGARAAADARARLDGEGPARPARDAPLAARARSASAAAGPKAARPAAPVADVAALTCPRCKQGTLLTGKRGWGCARWREGCPFVIWFETGGRRLSGAQLRDLVERGKTRKARFAPSDGGAAARGRLVLDLEAPAGSPGARFHPEID